MAEARSSSSVSFSPPVGRALKICASILKRPESLDVPSPSRFVNASFSRYIENGIFKNSGFNKTTGKFRLDQKLSKSLSFNFTVNYALTNREGVGTSGDSGRFNIA